MLCCAVLCCDVMCCWSVLMCCARPCCSAAWCQVLSSIQDLQRSCMKSLDPEYTQYVGEWLKQHLQFTNEMAQVGRGEGTGTQQQQHHITPHHITPHQGDVSMTAVMARPWRGCMSYACHRVGVLGIPASGRRHTTQGVARVCHGTCLCCVHAMG